MLPDINISSPLQTHQSIMYIVISLYIFNVKYQSFILQISICCRHVSVSTLSQAASESNIKEDQIPKIIVYKKLLKTKITKQEAKSITERFYGDHVLYVHITIHTIRQSLPLLPILFVSR